MAKLPNDGAPIGSSSSVGGKFRTFSFFPHTDGDGFLDLEDVLARLSITSDGAREILRALVALANTSASPDLASTDSTTSPDSPITASPTVAASVVSLSDLGDGGNPTPASSTTLVATPLNVTTPLNVASLTPVVAAAPVAIASPNLAAPTTNAVGVQTAVVAGATRAAAVGSATVSAAAVPAAAPAVVIQTLPLYNNLPVNAPANATLPPAHLLALPYGYHVPAANAEGPFYVVTRGRNVGVFNGWYAIASSVPSLPY